MKDSLGFPMMNELYVVYAYYSETLITGLSLFGHLLEVKNNLFPTTRRR